MESEHSQEAFRAGRRTGLAIAAIACSAVAFVSLLGAEKAILALVLAGLAWQGAAPRSRDRRLGAMAIGIASIYLISYVTVLVLFHAKIAQLIQLLQQLG